MTIIIVILQNVRSMIPYKPEVIFPDFKYVYKEHLVKVAVSLKQDQSEMSNFSGLSKPKSRLLIMRVLIFSIKIEFLHYLLSMKPWTAAKKSFKLVCRLFRFLAKEHLSRVSSQSHSSPNDRVIMR
jgi:hypothetical protein